MTKAEQCELINSTSREIALLLHSRLAHRFTTTSERANTDLSVLILLAASAIAASYRGLTGEERVDAVAEASAMFGSEVLKRAFSMLGIDRKVETEFVREQESHEGAVH